MLTAVGLAGAAAATVLPSLSACGVGGRRAARQRRVAGHRWLRLEEGVRARRCNILQTPHPYQQILPAAAQGVHRADRDHGRRRPGPRGRLLHQAQHRARRRLGQARRRSCSAPTSSGSTARPAGWRTSDPWLQNAVGHQRRSTTSRTSSRVCAPPPAGTSRLGNPLGTGGQWAIPWGFENNVVAYNKRIFDDKGIQAARHLRRLHRSWPSTSPTARRTATASPFRGSQVLGHHPPRLHDAVHPRGRRWTTRSTGAS